VYKKLTRRTTIAIVVAAVLAATVAIAVFVVSLPIRSETLKERVIELLSDQLESEVAIEHLEGRVFPRVSVSGRGVSIRHKGRTDVPPLITIERFEIRGSLRDLLRRPRHVGELRLQGLDVKIPPGDDRQAAETSGTQSPAQSGKLQQVVIDRFEAPAAVITLIPKVEGKQPKVFTIHHLVMERLGINQTIPYIATLTNPVPKGEIETSGTFGPWNVAYPARTPLAGSYVFANANLDTISGLAGTLRSTGTFQGPIDRIQVQGKTETPDFQVDVGGKPVPLTTQFTAIVDGSDGDTYLKKVDARILESDLTASGAVVGLEGVPGRRVDIDVNMTNGRIEDLLTLAVKSSEPILRGAVQLRAKLVIPPEKKKVIDRLRLRGDFGLSRAKFTDPGVQTKLIGLSRRGKGIKSDEPVGDVASNLRGQIVLENGVASFPRLTFAVPGAEVDLAGRYGLRSEALNFRGKLKMQATLSRVVGGGVKGFFLKAFDPFFKKPGAGMVLPIKIEGTRTAPKFGLDIF